MIFQLKQTSQDFYVSENLPFQLSGSGDAFYVQISKRNITTHDIIDHLRKELGITRMSLGIAGLKDKRAIAKQRISIYDRALRKAGGEKVFVNTLKDICKVVTTGRHHTPLNMSTPITNTFHITLTSTKNLWQTEKQKALQIVENLLDTWYPNLFGEQRFGINGRNARQGYEIMTGQSKEKFQKWEAIFKLQAYASKVCNDYIQRRVRKDLLLMDGDIVTRSDSSKSLYGIYHESDQTIHHVDIRSDEQSFWFVPSVTGEVFPYAPYMVATAPVPGYNCAIPDTTTPAGEREANVRSRHHLDPQSMKKYSSYPVYGLRRPIRVTPTQTKVQYRWDDLLIDFTLPSGSYASIVFDLLEEKLG